MAFLPRDFETMDDCEITDHATIAALEIKSLDMIVRSSQTH